MTGPTGPTECFLVGPKRGKTITTALLVIASIVATMALINAILPATGKGTGALLTANTSAADRIKTDVEIVFASGNATGDEITFWAKNVGSIPIKPISDSDIFLTTPSSVTRIPYTGSAAQDPRWEYTIEGGQSDWTKAVTIKVTLHLQTGSTGLHTVKMLLYNAVTGEKEFSI